MRDAGTDRAGEADALRNVPFGVVAVRANDAYRYRLDWFISFVSVVEHGGFSAAAQALYRSQSRISTHVAELERALGVRLFDRSQHPVALTAEGRALLPHARGILRHLRAATEEAGQASRRLRGRVRLGAYPSAAAHLLPLLLPRIAERFPGVEVVPWEGSTLELEAALIAGEVDFAVRPVLPVAPTGVLTCDPLWREPLVAVVSAERAPRVRSMSLAELAAEQLITIGDNSGRPGHYEAHLVFEQAGLVPEVVFRTNQPQTLIALVRTGMAIGVTNALAMTTANTGGVRLIPIDDVPRGREVALWWRTDRTLTAAQQAVRSLVADCPDPDFGLLAHPAPPTA
ncbi:LysR family transcriptional regulator [Saccharopolyspora cebuensis]